MQSRAQQAIRDSQAVIKTATSSGGDGALVAKPLPEFLKLRPVVKFLVDDMFRQGWTYSITSQPGGGKTGFGVYLSLRLAQGGWIGPYKCQPAVVLYIAAEQPEDVNMRFWLACKLMTIPAEARGRVHVIDKSFLLAKRLPELLAIIEELGVMAVVVDTDQAISLDEAGSEVNNSERMGHAKRLRELTRCATNPTVIDLCHPNAMADANSLRPRGGGAFLAEIDGNVMLSRVDDVVSVKTDPFKFRGMPWELTFRSKMEKCEDIKDTKGRLIPTPYLELMTEEQGAMAKVGRMNIDLEVLKLVHAYPNWTQNEIAAELGWLAPVGGEPDKSRMSRYLKAMRERKLLGTGLTIASAGKKLLKDAGIV